jgi:hypothetical protein
MTDEERLDLLDRLTEAMSRQREAVRRETEALRARLAADDAVNNIVALLIWPR